MRDSLQEEISEEREFGRAVARVFALHGYEEVGLPAFEYLDVLSRGLGTVGPELLLRFVEPETGHIVALRPDMTPQVARLIASRWPDAPLPLRLSYRGTVLRRRPERARHDFEFVQCGIELVGAEGVSADVEVVVATLAAVRAAGLEKFVLDLAHGGIAHGLLAEIPPALRADLLSDLARKDQTRVRERCQLIELDRDLTEALTTLPELQGGPGVLERARRLPGFRRAAPHLERLAELGARIESLSLAPRIVYDLGETRPIPYYTGMMFQVLAEGPGQAVASGGRYDELYTRFGIPRAAAGAAVNIDHLGWALGLHPRVKAPRLRVLVLAPSAGDASNQAPVAIERLRSAGIPAAPAWQIQTRGEALDYARLANYSFVAQILADGSVHLHEAGTGAELAQGTIEQIALYIEARARAGDPAFGALVS